MRLTGIAVVALALSFAAGACGHKGGQSAVRSLGPENASATPDEADHTSPSLKAGTNSEKGRVVAVAGTRDASPDTTVVVASRQGGTPPGPPPSGPPPTTTPGPPVSATLDRQCVAPGGTQTLTIHTAPNDHVYYSTEYADHTNENTPRGYQEGFGPGTADATGVFHATWRVPPNAPIGQAVVHYIAEYQAFTIDFAIAAVCP